VRVLGIDISLNSTGVCRPDGSAFTVKAKTITDQRLVDLDFAIADAVIMDQPGVDLAVIEDLPTHAMSAGKTGMAQGVVRRRLALYGIPVALVSPATLKKFATGNGAADKDLMREHLPQRLPMEGALKNSDEVDAYWLHLAGSLWYDGDYWPPRLRNEPFAGRCDVLAKAKWPVMPEPEAVAA
jgi:Holliday junction resolvasome RuvABC endonuclease subunit